MQYFSFDLAIVSVFLGILSAAMIAFDLWRHPQPMRIMNAVWILTGLWAGIFALAAYYAFGRVKPFSESMNMPKSTGMDMAGMNVKTDIAMKMSDKGTMKPSGMNMERSGAMRMPMPMPSRPYWQGLVLSTLHCGAGCTLADISGEWLMYIVPVSIGGSLVAGTWVTEYILALIFGVGFQYAAIRGMERIGRGKAILRAAKADFLSLTAWQAGMYIWLAFVIFGMGDGTPLPRTSFTFWFMMQVAMCVGFLLALPVNALLIRMGIKKAM